MQYRTVVNAADNTVGIENHNQNVGINYVYDDEYNPSATPLEDGLAIKFTTASPTIITSIDDQGLNSVPEQYLLKQNYPNPFNPTTTISYALPKSSHIRLDIYNIHGQLIKTLENSPKEAGFHSIVWNATNKSGNKVSSGIYFYRLRSSEFVLTKKLLLLK